VEIEFFNFYKSILYNLKMKDTIHKFEKILNTGLDYLNGVSELDMSQKESAKKWSKKEILGHLIDSGVNNLQRFTEIQFENKPYKIRPYHQEELVKANDYQNSDLNEIIDFWASINNRILNIIRKQTSKTLNFQIELSENNLSDLRFLINDYVDHLNHHLNQILE
jgi:hypothetical protein